MPEDKNQPEIQEVAINLELINNKMNLLAGMVVAVEEKLDKLIKKL